MTTWIIASTLNRWRYVLLDAVDAAIERAFYRWSRRYRRVAHWVRRKVFHRIMREMDRGVIEDSLRRGDYRSYALAQAWYDRRWRRRDRSRQKHGRFTVYERIERGRT